MMFTLMVRDEPTTANEVIKSIAVHDVPYVELIENEQEYAGSMLHYYGKISDIDEHGYADSTVKNRYNPRNKLGRFCRIDI